MYMYICFHVCVNVHVRVHNIMHNIQPTRKYLASCPCSLSAHVAWPGRPGSGYRHAAASASPAICTLRQPQAAESRGMTAPEADIQHNVTSSKRRRPESLSSCIQCVNGQKLIQCSQNGGQGFLICIYMYLFGEPLHFLADQPASDVLLNVSRRPVFLVAQCFAIPILTYPSTHTVSDSPFMHCTT